MKRKTLIGFGTIVIVALLFTGVWLIASKESMVLGFVNEINNLTKTLSKTVGEPPTIEGVRQAQIYLVERKPGLMKMMAEIKNSDDFSKKTEIANKFKKCREENRDAMAVIYNRFVSKSSIDNKTLNELKKQKLAKTSLKERRELETQIQNQTKMLEENVNLLEEIDALILNFEAIFDGDKENKL